MIHFINKWVKDKAWTAVSTNSCWGDSTINVGDTQTEKERVAPGLSTSTTETHSSGTSGKTPGFFWVMAGHHGNTLYTTGSTNTNTQLVGGVSCHGCAHVSPPQHTARTNHTVHQIGWPVGGYWGAAACTSGLEIPHRPRLLTHPRRNAPKMDLCLCFLSFAFWAGHSGPF